MRIELTDWRDADALREVARAYEHDTQGGLIEPHETGADLFRVIDDGGEMCGAIALLEIKWPGGREGCIVYLGGAAPRLCERLEAAVAEHFAGCAQMSMVTRRPGLVRRLEKMGWESAGTVMRKKL